MTEIGLSAGMIRATILAEWLGFPWSHAMGIEINNKTYNLTEFDDWLISSIGHETIRKKLNADGCGIYEETGMCVISWPDDTAQGDDLIGAVLEMIGKRG